MRREDAASGVDMAPDHEDGSLSADDGVWRAEFLGAPSFSASYVGQVRCAAMASSCSSQLEHARPPPL